MDLRLRDEDGIDAISSDSCRSADARIICAHGASSDEDIFRALDAGAVGTS